MGRVQGLGFAESGAFNVQSHRTLGIPGREPDPGGW